MEAARAGEAGAGFAVVADEVRNLAMRAAEAAKNTATLIEGSVQKIKQGSDIVDQTNSAFSQVADSSVQVGELVAEISAASSEQARGIEQVNTAVVEMDKVVQSNAASAEESAASAEEMNAQAEEMKLMILKLTILVQGTRRAKALVDTVYSKPKHPATLSPPPHTDMPAERSRSRQVTPEKVIPMDEADMLEF